MKISVIIPAYNHEQYITEAINSVLNQSYPDFEIIIINDGSTDSTEQKILSIHDPRIQYISQENSGAHSAINRGISLSQGEYISILNSDDVYLPTRLETCLNFLESNTNYSVVMSTVEGIDRDGTPVKKRVTPEIKAWLDWYTAALPLFKEDTFYPNAFAKNIMITTSNLFLRRQCFQECGGFKGLRYAHDWDMLLRLSQKYKIHLIEEDLLQYRMHPENTVHERDVGSKVQLEVNWLIIENLKKLKGNVSFPEILELLYNNRDLSFEVMLFLLLVKDQPAFRNLVDFNNPQAIQLLQLLQSGAGIATSFALKAQVQDLQTGNAWLTSQRAAWEKAASALQAYVQDMQAHVQNLQEGNAWLTSQREAWEKVAAEREQGIHELQVYIQDLQAGNTWLASQCEAWKKAAVERGETIAVLSRDLQDTAEKLKKMQSHILVRIINRLSGQRLF
ncbi:MAG: glycosyltransferase family 2 protein [Syntrophales bacterium]